MPKKGKKMLDYSIFFNQEHHKYISNQFFINKNKIHLTITFKNSSPSGLHIYSLIRFLHSKNLDFKFFSWTCRAKRKEETRKNSHLKSREHAHIIIYSKEDINSHIDAYFNEFNKYPEHIEQHYTTKIYEIEGLIKYIHDGHHKIYQSIYKITDIKSVTYHKDEGFINSIYKLDKKEEETKKSEPEILKVKIPYSLFFVKFKMKKKNYYYKLVKYPDTS